MSETRSSTPEVQSPRVPPVSDGRSPSLLSAVDLHKTYRLGRVDVPVLKGASLDVREGEWVAILGASGSGKSTLLHLLGDLDQPDPTGGGFIQFNGRDLNSMSRHQRNRYRNLSVGFVFQFYHLLPELNVLDNTFLPSLIQGKWVWWLLEASAAIIGFIIGAMLSFALLRLIGMLLVLAFGIDMARIPIGTSSIIAGTIAALIASFLWPHLVVRLGPSCRAKRERAEKLLESFGLGHRLKHRPRELSGGERQRVAIARALINQPRVLLADEPTGNLDEKTGEEILNLIAQQHEQGLTIVMVTHDRTIADRADRIVELHDGRVSGT